MVYFINVNWKYNIMDSIVIMILFEMFFNLIWVLNISFLIDLILNIY